MRKIKVVLCVCLILASLSVAAFAVSGTIQNITAQIRPDYVISLDGTAQTFQNASGEVVYPIVYEGTTYLPVRAIGELMDKNVEWDQATKTVRLNTKVESEPDDRQADLTQERILLPNASREENACGFFTATSGGVEFTITAAPATETYNVALYSDADVKIAAFQEVLIGSAVQFNGLKIGAHYHFKISSKDAPQSGSNAFFALKLT